MTDELLAKDGLDWVRVEAELEAAQSHPSAVLAAIETFNAVVDAETARKG